MSMLHIQVVKTVHLIIPQPYSIFYMIESTADDPRVLGLAMVPGKHIISIAIDDILLASQQMPFIT